MHTTRDRAVGSALLVATMLVTWMVTPGAAVTTIVRNSFDRQRTGALVTGPGVNQFSGTRGSSHLRVENTVAASPPNALAVTVVGGRSAYAYKQFRNSYTTYSLRFSLQLGPAFAVPHNHAVVLAQTVPRSSSRVGKVDVIVPADNRIRLDYIDSARHHRYLWGRFAIPRRSWHTVELRETVGPGSGSLALLVDRRTAAHGSKLALGTQGVTWFALGEEYAPPGRGYAGRLYIDDVTATSTPGVIVVTVS
jgi:hypothetical protein